MVSKTGWNLRKKNPPDMWIRINITVVNEKAEKHDAKLNIFMSSSKAR